jgi:hypothetical protein
MNLSGANQEYLAKSVVKQGEEILIEALEKGI